MKNTPHRRGLFPKPGKAAETKNQRDASRRYAELGLLTGLMLIPFILSRPGSAQAQVNPSLLVLNITEALRPQDDLLTYVDNALSQAGAQCVTPTELTAVERSCVESTCMHRLASAHHVDLILTARIERSRAPRRTVSMWLYDARTGGDQFSRGSCLVQELESCLGTLAQQLVGPEIHRQIIETPPVPVQDAAPSVIPAAKPPSESAKRESGRGLSRWRLGLGIGLGALATGSLIAAVVATAIHGQKVESGPCMPRGDQSACGYQLTSVFAPSYALAGVAAVSAVFSLTLPTSRAAHKEKR